MIRLDLDAKRIGDLINELGLTERQAKAALTRATQRTAATLRRRAETELKSDLAIRKVAYLRRRLKSVRLSRTGFEGLKLWFGENPMPISALRGSKRKTKTGARFTGKAGTQDFEGGFIAKGRHGLTIFQRKGEARKPIAEGEIPVQEQMDALIERGLFADCLEILWANFEREMMARAKFGVGVKG